MIVTKLARKPHHPAFMSGGGSARYALVLMVAMICLVVSPRPALASDSLNLYFMSFSSGQDAIILECDGSFAMVDAGEDDDYPDGSSARYPYRTGTTVGQGHTDELISYLYDIGATRDNFVFFIGTHAHSDHIGSADEIVREFNPERVYIPQYDDSYIWSPYNLWDNQYVYDHLLTAADDVGAAVISQFAYEGGLYPDVDGFASPTFDLGDAQIRVMNWENHDIGYQSYKDANDYSWGVLVSYEGRTAFLAGDINNNNGDEDVLATQLGHVDVLKLGHHGNSGSNTEGYLRALSPSVVVQTGSAAKLPSETFDTLLELGCHHYVCPEAGAAGKPAIRVSLTDGGVVVDALADPEEVTFREDCGSHDAVAYRDGAPVPYTGSWLSGTGELYLFDNSPYGVSQGAESSFDGGWVRDRRGWWWRYPDGTYPTSRWLTVNDATYYFNVDGYMATGWVYVGRSWYYLAPSGALCTGWRRVGGTWYYLDPAHGGAMAKGLFEVGGKRYAASSGGACPVSGWVRVGSDWYLTNGSCVVRTGWAKAGSTWYLLDEDAQGAMVTGWAQRGDMRYYLGPSGAMATGWKRVDGSWYYFATSGAMQTGWTKVGRSWYWLDTETGAMLEDGYTPDGYYVNASGAWVR